MFLEKRNGVTLCKGSSTKIKLENRQELMNETIGAVTYLRGIVKIAVCVIVALSIVYRFMKFIQFVYKWVVLIDIVKIREFQLSFLQTGFSVMTQSLI